MRFFDKALIRSLSLAAGLLVASTASADGLVASPADLSGTTRAKLETAIAKYKASHPEAFTRVRNVKGHRPEHYKKLRNPIPMVDRELRRLGKQALLPMLEALAFQAPSRGGLQDHEWRALKVGMLEAVGVLRDPRARPVLFAAFANAQHPKVERAAAEAIGDLCDGASIDTLEAALGTAKRAAAITGLGHCRSVEAAQILGDLLDSAQNAGEATAIAEALGYVGSSWGWKALGADRAAEALEVRNIAAAALVRGFVRFDGRARTRHGVALRMVAHPQMRAVARDHRSGADGSAEQALNALVQEIEKNR